MPLKTIGTVSVLLTVLFNSILTACNKPGKPTASSDPSSTPSAATPIAHFSTDTLLGDGVNLQPSYFNGGKVTFGYDLMQQFPNIESVRIEIEPSIPVSVAASWIHEALKNGYRVIATYHKYSVLGTDDTAQLDTAALWWKTNYYILAAAGPFTINLMNEWGSHNQTPHSYATAYNHAIAIVRQVYRGPLILDCPGYGQETSVAADAVKGSGGVTLNDTNIILSAHIYPNGYNQANRHVFQRSDLDSMAAAERPCIVGEFGNYPSGKADWMNMVVYARSRHWAVLGWAWNGDGGMMNMVTPSWKSVAGANSYGRSGYFISIYNLL